MNAPTITRLLEAATLIQADYRGDTPLTDVSVCKLPRLQARIVLCWGHPVLLIRGTDQRIDWIDNVAIWPTALVPASGKRGFWHRGFLRQSIKVCKWAKDHQPVDFIIGHSLGGAIAQIVGVSEGYNQTQTITFAAPRPAWLYNPDTPPTNVFNYRRMDDLVARTPPWFLGYRHVGKTITLPVPWRIGESHRIEHYVQALRSM